MNYIRILKVCWNFLKLNCKSHQQDLNNKQISTKIFIIYLIMYTNKYRILLLNISSILIIICCLLIILLSIHIWMIAVISFFNIQTYRLLKTLIWIFLYFLELVIIHLLCSLYKLISSSLALKSRLPKLASFLQIYFHLKILSY